MRPLGRAALRAALTLCRVLSCHGFALFSKFRELNAELAAEWNRYRAANAAQHAHLANNAIQHHYSVSHFCRHRPAGCSWAEHHALVDHSLEPFGHLFDQNRIKAEVPRQAASCARLHKPSAEDLLDLVRRSQPAVLSGLLDGWPALQRWDYAYLRRHLGEKPVTVSVAEGLYDVPEDPAIWGVGDRNLSSVVARPAHETMRFAEALSHFESSSTREIAPTPAEMGPAPAPAPATAAASAVEGRVDGGRRLRYYLEYFPMEVMRTGRLRNDLRHNVRATTDADSGPPTTTTTTTAGTGPPCSSDSTTAMHSEAVCEARGSNPDSDPAAGQPVSITATSEPEPERKPTESGADADADVLPTLSTDGEPGELAIADWLLPRKHLLWMGGGGTVGATHYDPYENLMAVIVGSKTFHLASPDDGPKIGAFTPMAEGTFELHPGTAGRPPMLGRSAAKVTQATSLHHYAAAVLSKPAQQQSALPRMAEATVFSCTAQAGEVLYVPSYWWHEVHSSPGAADRPSVGINWFYESYYQRIFPNQSWDRSLHYLMLNAPSGNPLRTPFPPHGSARSGGTGTALGAAPAPRSPKPRGNPQPRQPTRPATQHPTSQRAAGVGTESEARTTTTRPLPPVQPVQSPSGPPPPPTPRARKTASFAERLKQRASAHEQGAQGS